MIQIYEFTKYKPFIRQALEARSSIKKGARSALAQFIGCQNAYVSHVLNGDYDFSLEQGVSVTEFFGLSEDEAHYFFLLLQRDRAGKKSLRDYFDKQIEKILQNRKAIQNRLGMRTELSDEHRLNYYSSWVPGAVHMMLLIPDFQAPELIAERLRVPLSTIQQTIQFLANAGLIELLGKNIKVNLQWIYLPTQSPLIRQHHTNWRLHALQSLNPNISENLNHSGALAVSKDDAKKIREIFLAALDQIKAVVKDSKEEDVFALNIDFYRI